MAAEANIVKRTLKTTALYKAVLADDLSTIQKLLKENPKLIFTDYMQEDKQRGLLYIIFELEKVEIAKMLMNEHPEDFKLAVQKDTDLLELALDKNRSIELVSILIPNGVDVNCTIHDGYWEMKPLNKAVEKANTVLVEILIKAGANANAYCRMVVGFTRLPALYDAIKNNNVEIVRILVNAGADVNEKPPSSFFGFNPKMTLLDWAIQRNHTEVAKILIEAGADVDIQQFNRDKISNEMWTVLVDYPSHLARKQEILKIWAELGEGQPLSIQNDEKEVEAKRKEEMSPKTSLTTLSDKSPAFFYTHFIQWLPPEVLKDTLDLIVFPEFSKRKNML